MRPRPPYVRRRFPTLYLWRGMLGAISHHIFGTNPNRADTHPFDLRFRVDTAGLFYADQLTTGHHRDAQSAGYYATAPSLFRGALYGWLATLGEIGLRPADYAFVDLGCGKGRALLLASEYPFREIVGIELHPGLAETARRNVRLWLARGERRRRWLTRAGQRRTRPNVRVLEGDALVTPFPPGPLLIFFFNSFERGMIDPFLDRLLRETQTRTDPIDLIYIHPEFGSLFRRNPGVRVLADLEITLTPEDAAADIFGVATDRVAIYRFDPQGAPPRAA